MQLAWTAPALSDLRRIGAYLEREARPEASFRILELIRDRSTIIADFPFAGPAVADCGFRSLRVHETPYILLYRVSPNGSEILRVHHERENWRPAT